MGAKMTRHRHLMLAGGESVGEANGIALENGAELLMKASKMTREEVRALLNQFSAGKHIRRFQHAKWPIEIIPNS